MGQNTKKEWDVLALLICADLLYILLHILHYTTPYANSRFFAVQLDGGFAEFYQYLKELWLCIILFVIFFRSRQPVFAVCALMAGYFLLDDAFMLHETLGMKLVFHLNLRPHLLLRSQDWGELLVMSFFSMLFLSSLLLLMKNASPKVRDFVRLIWPYALLLLFFSVLMDMVDIMISGWGAFLLEDGGEMVAMSLLLWRIWRFYQPFRTGRLPSA
jgi:hypothetical protein